MQYADYNWYIFQFWGTKLNENEFNHYALKASAKVDHYTFGRAAKATDTDTVYRIKNAVCAVAEKIAQYEAERLVEGVKSESNDGYSVTYSDDVYDTTEHTIYATIYDWLAPTGLMYRGVGSHD